VTIGFSEHHEQLRAEIRKLLVHKSGSAQVREAMTSDLGYDDDLWAQMATQLGLTGLAVPEEYGGAGGGLVEIGIVCEELGRMLTPSPYFATVACAAAAIIGSSDTTAVARYLPSIIDGSLTACLAVGDESGSWSIADVQTAAVPAEDCYALTGVKNFVVDGNQASLLVVLARAAEGVGLFAVNADGDGVQRRALEALDPTRRMAHLTLSAAPALLLGELGDDVSLQKTLDRIVVALAAEQLGGASRCLEMATDYAKIRVQFGRPIGSFQAIKHKCADMLMQVESARSSVYEAMHAEDPNDLAVAAAAAGAYTSEAYSHAAKENVQIHGGIGYTWEHDAHLYLKRAKSNELAFIPPARHRVRLAGLIGVGAAS
jgi:alkylation response protein AidB-like acyl-CoA dehydrogenase